MIASMSGTSSKLQLRWGIPIVAALIMAALLATFFVSTGGVVAAAPVTMTLSPSGDSSVGIGAPTSTAADFGFTDIMAASEGGLAILPSPLDERLDALVRFDLSSIPGGAVVASATLNLVNAIPFPVPAFLNSTNDYTIHAITADWDQDTVTWDSSDGEFDPAPIDTQNLLTSASLGDVYPFDVTGDVQATVNGADNFGWRIIFDLNTNGPITLAAFGTSENATPILRPTLVVEFTPPGVTVTESDGSTDLVEGGATDTYTVVLDTPPTADVDITVTPDVQVTVNPAQLTFTPSNWNTPQTVTVTAVDDGAVEGAHPGTITHTATSSDGNYDGMPIAPVVANITDNDGVTIVELDGSTDIAEGGATDTYTVVLDERPTTLFSFVTVSITPDAQSTVSTGTLLFTFFNWDTPQTVTVTAVDDLVAEGPHTSRISHTSASNDPKFSGIAIDDVVANITDNDGSVTVAPTEVAVAEGGATANYTIVLDDMPSGTVNIDVATDGQTTVVPTSLTFTPANFAVPQTVTVTAVDDGAVEGSHSETITHSASGGGYDGVSIDDVVANITDNDAVGFTVTPDSATVSETGTSVAINVVLTGRPNSNVEISISSADTSEVGVSPSSLTFTASNWNVTQQVMVTGVDDRFLDGHQVVAVTLSIDSSDAAFAALADQTVTVTNMDDELSPPRPPTAPAPQPPVQTTVIPEEEIQPAAPEEGLVEVVQPNGPDMIELDGTILEIPATVRQASFQVRVQPVGLEAPAGVDGAFIRNIALDRFAPVGLDTQANQPDGQVIRAVQLDLFDANGDPIQDVRSFQGIKIRVQLSDQEIEDLGGFSALIVGDRLGRLQIQLFTPSETGGSWSRVNTQLDITNRAVLATTSRLTTFALVWGQPATFGRLIPKVAATVPSQVLTARVAALTALPCPPSWRAARAC